MKKQKILLILSLVLIFILLLGGVLFFVAFPIKHKNLVAKYANIYDLNEELVLSLINVESSFDENALSNAGAMGLMQILPSTAMEIAPKIGLNDFKPNDLYNPEININIGCYYLRYLLNLFENDEVKALCAYNAGFNRVYEWLDEKGKLTEIAYKETRNYVKKIQRNIKVYKYIY